MNLFCIRPPVADLVFQLYGKPLHPELFDILAARRIQRENYQLTVQITRTGHVLSYQSGDLFLTEVADVDQSLPNHRRLLHYKMRGEHSATHVTTRNIAYQTSFQVETLPPDIFVHVHDDILADGAKRGLLHNFQPNHRLAIAPLGFVTAESRQGCLFLATFHTFPEEYTVVKTQSLIEKRA